MSGRNQFNFGDSQSVDTEGSWAVSYGDMITLLLSFFVIYFSTDFNKQVEEKLGKKVETEIKQLAADLKKGVAIEEFGDGLVKSQSLNNLSLAQGEDVPVGIDIKVYKAGKNFLILFKGVSFFNSGHVELRSDAKKVLAKVVSRLEPFLSRYKLKIRAFTDDTPVSSYHSRFKDNLELSALRSISTMRELEHAGVPRRRMEVAGYGPMSNRLLKFLHISNDDDKVKKALSRSVMILLKREDYEQS